MTSTAITIDDASLGKAMVVPTGRIDSISATIRGAASAVFVFEASIDGGGWLPLGTITLSSDGQTDGISFIEPFRYPLVRVRRTDGSSGTPAAAVFGGTV